MLRQHAPHQWLCNCNRTRIAPRKAVTTAAIQSSSFSCSAVGSTSLRRTCGSIISGQRLPRVTKMLLSIEVPSLGSPASSHSLTSTGLASVPRSVQFWLTGMASA
jgi:hypothetical protein